MFAVNLTCWRAFFKISILFFDFFLGWKSDISGSYSALLADIGGFFLNETTKHFMSNLLFSFVFLHSIWPNREVFLSSLSFCFTFSLLQKVTFLAVLAHFQHILEFFFWISCQIDLGVIHSSPSPFFEIAIPFSEFFGSNNEILGSFGTFLAHYWRFFSE